MDQHTLPVIGTLQSVFKEKFGTPRQSGLSKHATALLRVEKSDLIPDPATAFRGLETYSHVWLIFLFHQAIADGAKTTVRMPRLGGKARTGVYASRSPHRPGFLGLSAVRLEKITHGKNASVELHLSGIDLVDGTPVFDVKPYIPYADKISNTRTPMIEKPAHKLPIRWKIKNEIPTKTRKLIQEVLALDPRPAHQTHQPSTYAMKIDAYDVHWVVKNGVCEVRECTFLIL